MKPDYLTDVDTWSIVQPLLCRAPSWSRWLPYWLRRRIWIPLPPPPPFDTPAAGGVTAKFATATFDEWRALMIGEEK